MKIAPIPLDEEARLQALKEFLILDTPPEPELDSITNLASKLCATPIAVISLVDSDREWFKSKVGITVDQLPRKISFCSHAILEKKFLEVPDARIDERFRDNPLVCNEPNLVFYAGTPLIDSDGNALGSLCVIGFEPKVLTEDQRLALTILGQQVVAHFNLRKIIKFQKETLKALEKLSANIPGMIYQFQLFPDGRTCVPYTSAKIEEIYELTPEQVKTDASLLFERLHPRDLYQVGVSIQESARTMSPWLHEFRVQLPKRGLRWMRGNSLPELLADGSHIWHGFVSDITLEKNIQVMNIQNEKMKSLGEMSAGIAHEINNPLAIIKGRIDIILDMMNSRSLTLDEIPDRLKSIDKTVDRIAKIINGLRSFARDSSQDPMTMTLLKSILEDSASLCQARFKTSEVTLEIPFIDEEIKISCRASQISQVLVNLLSNAFDAVKDLPEKWIKVSVEAKGQYILISITDSGPGIPEELREKILQPFFTTKEIGKGTGLGLSISLGILKAHGGELEIDKDCPNTKFVIKLPRMKL